MTAIELKDDLPAMSPENAKYVMARYKSICESMLDASDYATIQGKPFKKKSAWRKLARAFGISDEIIKEEKEQSEKGFAWRIHVRASAANGRSAIGVASCSSTERQFVHVEHDVYATAHTRAKNRAISDLLGAGETSAEEMEADENSKEYADKINAKAQQVFK